MRPRLGDRVRATGVIPDDPDPIPVGAEGTVDWLGTGQIGVQWDNGRSLLLPDDDPFVILGPGDQHQPYAGQIEGAATVFTPQLQDELTTLVIGHSGARIGEFLLDRANAFSYEDMAARRDTAVADVKDWLVDWDNAINGVVPETPKRVEYAALMVRYAYDRGLMTPALYEAATAYLHRLRQANPAVKLERAYGRGHGGAERATSG